MHDCIFYFFHCPLTWNPLMYFLTTIWIAAFLSIYYYFIRLILSPPVIIIILLHILKLKHLCSMYRLWNFLVISGWYPIDFRDSLHFPPNSLRSLSIHRASLKLSPICRAVLAKRLIRLHLSQEVLSLWNRICCTRFND